MDVLFLLFNKGGEIGKANQLIAVSLFAHHIESFHSSKTIPRVMGAVVYDRFSALDPNVNVTSWQFLPLNKINILGYNHSLDHRQEYKNIQETVDLKVTFVHRLFSEMSGVRQNVSHVAVIFLDGYTLSEEESRHAKKIVEEQNTNIKIFVIVFGGVHTNQMKDIFNAFAKAQPETIYASVLILQVCNECPVGFYSLEHSVGADSLSCYILIDNGNTLESMLAVSTCLLSGGFPAHISSQEDLGFVQSILKAELHKRGINFTTEVFIGLYRYLNVAKDRFGWILTYPIRVRPLIINQWLPGKPSTGQGRICVVWQFEWRDHISDVTTISNNKSHFVDGWTDVGCDTKARFTLCEIVLPRRLEDMNLTQIKPDMNESLHDTLSKGDFIKFEDNIVSISTYISNKTFVQFLKYKNFKLFPLFDCGDDAGEYRYISYMLVCDSLNDCSNRRDERFCPKKESSLSFARSDIKCREDCKGIYCCSGVCLDLTYDTDGKVNCDVCLSIEKSDGFTEDQVSVEYKKTNKTSAFICSHRKCVFSPELTSSLSKCDRPQRLVNKTRGNNITCRNILGNSFWAPSCLYVKDKYGAVLDCRLMSHLANCKDFVCPEGYVKCPNTYCIPQHYVLDGQDDCPTGEDENVGNISPCTGNFACWDSKVCLHPDLVCDGHPDCPHRDDEIDCKVECAEGFRCVSGTVTISNYTAASQNMFNPEYKNIRFMNYSGNDLNKIYYKKTPELNNVVFVDFSNCGIIDVWMWTATFYFRSVQILDLSYNVIQEFDGSVIDLYLLNNLRFLNLSHNTDLVFVDTLQYPYLETLDLSHTALSSLGQSALRGLPNLKHLDISFTLISRFDGKNKFPTNFYPQTLNVRGLPIDNLYEDFYKGLSVSQHLYTDRFELCCALIRRPNIPAHVCHAPDDAISSCSDLIAVNVQLVLLWMVAVLAVLGNLTVIGYRLILDRSSLRTGFGMFVTNLGISDFIMGVYLFIIVGADYYYRDIYVLYDKTWRESIVCRLAGFLATLSSETSTFFVFLITLDRFLMMKFPAGQIKFYEKGKIIALLLSWIVGSILALIPIVFKLETYSSNAVCLGLPLATKRTKGWEFSFSVFIVLNFFLFLVIAYGQRAIFAAMSEKRITGTASNTSSRKAQDIIVAKQLSLVALSNFLCWFPIGFMGLLSLVGREISNDVYAWTTVIVLPINSAANPLLYTIPVLVDKWNKFKSGEKRSQIKTN